MSRHHRRGTPNRNPLRKIVREWSDGVTQWEDLDCGHTVRRKSDIIGPTNAFRRRCWQCAAAASNNPPTTPGKP